MDSQKSLEENFINFLILQTNKNAPKISQEDMVELNELFNNHLEYFITLMKIIKNMFFVLSPILKISVLIQLKNFLSKFLNSKKNYILPDFENNTLIITELFCNIEKEKKIKTFLKIILIKMLKINKNYTNNNYSKGKNFILNFISFIQ